MESTCKRIRQQMEADGVLFRYREDDGLPPGEGAFGICGFWEVENLALQGRQRDAERSSIIF
jgi:alpha,alpha-trehalase